MCLNPWSYNLACLHAKKISEEHYHMIRKSACCMVYRWSYMQLFMHRLMHVQLGYLVLLSGGFRAVRLPMRATCTAELLCHRWIFGRSNKHNWPELARSGTANGVTMQKKQQQQKTKQPSVAYPTNTYRWLEKSILMNWIGNKKSLLMWLCFIIC